MPNPAFHFRIFREMPGGGDAPAARLYGDSMYSKPGLSAGLEILEPRRRVDRPLRTPLSVPVDDELVETLAGSPFRGIPLRVPERDEGVGNEVVAEIQCLRDG